MCIQNTRIYQLNAAWHPEEILSLLYIRFRPNDWKSETANNVTAYNDANDLNRYRTHRDTNKHTFKEINGKREKEMS